MYQHDPEEEHPRPEYLAQLERVEARTLNPVTRTLEPRPPFWGMQVSVIAVNETLLDLLKVVPTTI